MLKNVSLVLIALSSIALGQNKDNYFLNSGKVSALKFRNVGPALTAGRISDIAVNPNNHSEYYITVASGGVWKTTNSGNTYQPIFDAYGSYSIGCITIDPNNPHRIWVGTGENNNQRSVAYGDGIYKSEDGGMSWTNMGLENSEHIHKIIVHPNNSNVVYVASNGPLWRSGGERGVYKTSDGGESWEQIFSISEHTGATDLVMDHRNPDVLYVSMHQRRRHVWTYLGGGPESGIHKTTDGGKTWKKAQNGLPSVDLGRIGLAISPVNPDIVYAIVEASQGKGGFYKSTNRGASWSKMSGYTTSGNYYQELVCHPTDVDIVFSMNTWLHHTEDGGKTFQKTGEKHKHVDNHCMWIDPDDNNHWIVGCDGGLYETWDAASNWHYKPNLPITQFYKVAVDEALPFYNIYGGTQDNNSLGGPSRTINNAGILNSDWYITNGGDGFESAIDPENPNIVYAQAQYGWLVRYDKQSGERVAIQPQTQKGEPGLRWNWDAPLLISPHNHKRLYFAANKVFRSDDQGSTWQAISGDLTRQIDRNTLPVMDRIWSIDAVMKNRSTTIYGNIVALDESPKQENLIYIGTDDGLIQITEDAGNNWRKVSSFPGIPEKTYVNMIVASQFDANTVYACFNNHKQGDFKPYILKSSDKGKSWSSISGDLPEGAVYAIAQDHVNKDLLFAGTEFGVFFTINGGKNWVQLKSGLPTVAIRDIAIQRRENDLVLASFGRSFYVLDDYTPLRSIEQSTLDKAAHIFPIKDALLYVESNPLGLKGVGSQGESMYTASNPPVGAVFTFYMKESIQTLQEQRRENEKALIKEGKAISYPSKDEILAEEKEESPYLLFIIKDSNGDEVKRMKQGVSGGMRRVVWNFRYNTTTPVKINESPVGRYSSPDDGFLALPGTYTVEVHKSINGKLSQLLEPQSFEVKMLNNRTLPDKNLQDLNSFYKTLSDVRRRVRGSSNQLGELSRRVEHIDAALQKVAGIPLDIADEVKALKVDIEALSVEMWGEGVLSKHQFETPDGFASRIEYAVYSSWYANSAPTKTAKEQLAIGTAEYEQFVPKVHAIIKRIETLEAKLDANGVNYTPGRGSSWKTD